VILYHRIDDPESAAVRRRVVELGIKAQVDFQNVDADGAEAFARHGGRQVPALWDGKRLHEGRVAVLAVIETLRR
jgi:glutathione S-transferase